MQPSKLHGYFIVSGQLPLHHIADSPSLIEWPDAIHGDFRVHNSSGKLIATLHPVSGLVKLMLPHSRDMSSPRHRHDQLQRLPDGPIEVNAALGVEPRDRRIAASSKEFPAPRGVLNSNQVSLNAERCASRG